MAGSKGLGRGLDVLLKGLTAERDNIEVTMIRLDSIHPNPRQPRTEFSQESLEDLANSIKEQGVLQPILVRPLADGPSHGYELVAGERRTRACRLAGLLEIPAIVREVSDEQSLAEALIENLQREDLNPLEEAKGLDQLMKGYTLNQEALAQKVGKSRSAVANSLRLLQLPQAAQESLLTETITAGHARALLAVSDPAVQEALWRRVVGQGLSVREAEAQASHWKEHGVLPAGPDLAEEAPRPAARKRQPLDPELKSLEQRLRERFGFKVRLGGDPGQGRITFSYASPEELQDLLSHWDLSDD